MVQLLVRDSKGRFASKSSCKPKGPRKPKLVRKIINHICVVLDSSGSMYHLRSKAIDAYNKLVSDIKNKSKEYNQETYLSVCFFNHRTEFPYKGVDLNQITDISGIYRPNGQTALFDAVGQSISLLSQHEQKNVPPHVKNTSFVVLVITDGQENSSCIYTAKDLVRLIKSKIATDEWTITFSVPNGCKDTIKNLGIDDGNIQEWEQTEIGIEKNIYSANSVGLTNFFDARQRGLRSVSSFYVQTDLSNLSKSVLTSKLNDISGDFKSYTVDREVPIKQFVEEKTNKPYVLGYSYYNLSKPEEVQPQKEILITEKGRKEVWGGREARDLIGLPHGYKAKVVPGNHANYDIYVQSTSVNRKLVRGTKVLVRK